MKQPFFFSVNNMGGCVLGASDWGFALVVYAETADEAKTWGLNVAKMYSDRFGFEPHNIKVPHAEIESASEIDSFPDYDPAEVPHPRCDAGTIPEEFGL